MSYQLVRDFVYELGKAYIGDAVESTFTFSTPKGPLGSNVAQNVINELQQQCLANSPALYTLRTKVYIDSSPILTNDYLVTFDLYTESAISGMGGTSISLPAWLIEILPQIITAVLIIAVVVFAYLTMRTIRDIAYSPAGPQLATGFKWLAVGVAVLAGGWVISKVVEAIPKRQPKTT
jgi:hypothetical protein